MDCVQLEPNKPPRSSGKTLADATEIGAASMAPAPRTGPKVKNRAAAKPTNVFTGRRGRPGCLHIRITTASFYFTVTAHSHDLVEIVLLRFDLEFLLKF